MAKGIYERRGKNSDVTYYIRYQADGTDIKERVGRKSRGFTRELAKEALKSRLGDLAQGHFNLEKVRKPVPFSKLAERYKEFAAGYKRGWQEEKYIVEEFAKLFSDTPLANITTWQIEKWKAEQGRTLNLATVNRRLTVIKHMFKKALEWDLAKANPATAVKRFTITSERTRFLSGGEIQRLLQECENQVTSPWLLPLLGAEHWHEAGRTVSNEVGERQLRARHDQHRAKQNSAAEKHRHEPTDQGRFELAPVQPLRRSPVYVAVGRQDRQGDGLRRLQKGLWSGRD